MAISANVTEGKSEASVTCFCLTFPSAHSSGNTRQTAKLAFSLSFQKRGTGYVICLGEGIEKRIRQEAQRRSKHEKRSFEV